MSAASLKDKVVLITGAWFDYFYVNNQLLGLTFGGVTPVQSYHVTIALE